MFLGSVFSPYYAAARRKGPQDPLNFCAVNISLTGQTRRWCMTERPRRCVNLQHNSLSIGSSRCHYHGSTYQFDLNERASPLPRPVCGSVFVDAQCPAMAAFNLDGAGHHYWLPLAPLARISVRLIEPRLQWNGHAYLDSNRGDRALAEDFSSWQWSRASCGRCTTVYYEPQLHGLEGRSIGVRYSKHGQDPVRLPDSLVLPRSGWGIERIVRCDAASRPSLVETLVDAPFYARSLLRATTGDEPITIVHESLNLNRLSRRWVQYLLPFRMPRLATQVHFETDS